MGKIDFILVEEIHIYWKVGHTFQPYITSENGCELLFEMDRGWVIFFSVFEKTCLKNGQNLTHSLPIPNITLHPFSIVRTFSKTKTASSPCMPHSRLYIHSSLLGMIILLGKLTELYGKFSKNTGGFVVRKYFRKFQHILLTIITGLVCNLYPLCNK